MARTLSLTNISQMLNDQQKAVGIIDEYIRPMLLTPDNFTNATNKNFYADFVMQHIFVNIRNSYQDGLFISQGLIENTPYYVSLSLSHAQRSAQESLIDLAYIMSDRKHNSGYEYLRYLKFVVDRGTEESGRRSISEDRYNEIFPDNLDLERKSKIQWSHTSRKEKIKKGLELYKIESLNLTEFRFKFYSALSSSAHGNSNTIYTLTRTPEENHPKLEADFKLSIGHFEVVLKSTLECYVKLYLGRNNDYREIVESIYPDK